MLTEEEKIQSENAKKKWESDKVFQYLVSDLKDTVFRYRTNFQTNIPNVSEDQKKMILADVENRKEIISNRMKELVSKHILHKRFLNNIVGLNDFIEAALLSQIDLLKINYASQVIAFAGLIPSKNTSNKFNHFLKSVMFKHLAKSFIESNSPYAQYYWSNVIYILNRDMSQIQDGIMSSEFGKPEENLKPRHTAVHIDKMAKNYMLQKFIQDYYEAGRNIMGMPAINGYAKKHTDENGKVVENNTVSKLVKWTDFASEDSDFLSDTELSRLNSNSEKAKANVLALKEKAEALYEHCGYDVKKNETEE